jgi:predicted nucleic acid-binding protein
MSDIAIAPAFWPQEVLNALLSAERRGRISAALTRQFLEDLATLPIRLEQFSSDIVFDRIESLSRTYTLTATMRRILTWRSIIICRSQHWIWT